MNINIKTLLVILPLLVIISCSNTTAKKTAPQEPKNKQSKAEAFADFFAKQLGYFYKGREFTKSEKDLFKTIHPFLESHRTSKLGRRRFWTLVRRGTFEGIELDKFINLINEGKIAEVEYNPNLHQSFAQGFDAEMYEPYIFGDEDWERVVNTIKEIDPKGVFIDYFAKDKKPTLLDTMTPEEFMEGAKKMNEIMNEVMEEETK